MQYRPDKYGNPVSVLGYGCMRFSQKAGRPDMAKTEAEIMEAYRAGVNYFDTAYIYPGSEAALGEILERNGIRGEVNIATKLPHYLIKSRADAERFFAEELRRLRTDRVDYYLMHMLSDVKTWERLLSLGVGEWIEEKKKSGQIRQIGFSYHGNSDAFMALVDAYDWDFCLVQYNYLDEHTQAGRTGVQHAAKKGMPVLVMEPLRGGRLVKNLPEQAKKLFAGHSVQRTPAQWSFDWLWDQEEITCVLSGMNSVEMVRENASAASQARAGSLTEADRQLLRQVVAAINAKMKVGCTGCRYCMPCPKNVDIPGVFSAYNQKYTEGWFSGIKSYVMCTALRKDPTPASNCVGCGLCEKHCPQKISIREELKNVRREMEGPAYHAAKAIIPKIMKY
ncbi:MAG: aldo/keto reductase [Eubacteriales bacterium]|nr:aldo/keto reductase [Eubacteriales bacterium]